MLRSAPHRRPRPCRPHPCRPHPCRLRPCLPRRCRCSCHCCRRRRWRRRWRRRRLRLYPRLRHYLLRRRHHLCHHRRRRRRRYRRRVREGRAQRGRAAGPCFCLCSQPQGHPDRSCRGRGSYSYAHAAPLLCCGGDEYGCGCGCGCVLAVADGFAPCGCAWGCGRACCGCANAPSPAQTFVSFCVPCVVLDCGGDASWVPCVALAAAADGSGAAACEMTGLLAVFQAPTGPRPGPWTRVGGLCLEGAPCLEGRSFESLLHQWCGPQPWARKLARGKEIR